MFEILAVMAVVAWATKCGSQDKKRQYLEEEQAREKQFKNYDSGYYTENRGSSSWDH
jgi:hypothetical protein